MKTKDLTATIKRLKKETQGAEDAGKAAGRLAGETWARQQARLYQLQILAGEHPGVSHNELTADLYESFTGLRLAETKTGYDEAAHDRRFYEPGFLAGFTEAAVEVWHQVKTKVLPSDTTEAQP